MLSSEDLVMNQTAIQCNLQKIVMCYRLQSCSAIHLQKIAYLSSEDSNELDFYSMLSSEDGIELDWLFNAVFKRCKC